MVANEYVIARLALLDVLEALEPHIESLILVGSQAIYLRSPDDYGGVAAYTTDADLAIDPALLGTDPEIKERLHDAGFQIDTNSGHWVNGMDVAIDLMVPEGVSTTPTKRSAVLEGHDKSAARNARGLEPALHLNSLISIKSLEDGDERMYSLKVAENAALLIGKTIKVKERLGNPKRELPKDASDVLRILRQLDPREAGRSLKGLLNEPSCSEVIAEAMEFLASEMAARDSALIRLTVEGTAAIESAQATEVSLRNLTKRVLDSYHDV